MALDFNFEKDKEDEVEEEARNKLEEGQAHNEKVITTKGGNMVIQGESIEMQVGETPLKK